jgi:hypothetical protein
LEIDHQGRHDLHTRRAKRPQRPGESWNGEDVIGAIEQLREVAALKDVKTAVLKADAPSNQTAGPHVDWSRVTVNAFPEHRFTP